MSQHNRVDDAREQDADQPVLRIGSVSYPTTTGEWQRGRQPTGRPIAVARRSPRPRQVRKGTR
jgi:hypothetical protein